MGDVTLDLQPLLFVQATLSNLSILTSGSVRNGAGFPSMSSKVRVENSFSCSKFPSASIDGSLDSSTTRRKRSVRAISASWRLSRSRRNVSYPLVPLASR